MNVLVKSVKSVDVPSAAEGSAGNMGIIEKKAEKSIKASGFESVTNLDIQALVDNELDSSKKDLVKTIIGKQPSLERKFDELCRQKELLRLWWKHTAQNI